MGVKFEKVKDYKGIDFELPKRKTAKSAGYDFMIPETVTIPSHYKQLFKLLMARLSSAEVQSALFESELATKLMEIGESKTPDIEKQQELVMDLMEDVPAALALLQSQMNLTLNEIKALTKETNTRMTLVPTGVKAKLKDNQKLELMIRSSTPLGSYVTMANNIGLIDSDYYNNPDNEGHIYFQLINLSPFDITLEKGDIIGQGVISEYSTIQNDQASGDRVGGLGSTNKEGER